MLESLALRERVVDFAAAAQGLDAARCASASWPPSRTCADGGAPAPRAPEEPAAAHGAAAEIDLADIQGNVLRGYTYPSAAYLFLHIDDAERARALMTRTLPQVATAEPWRRPAAERRAASPSPSPGWQALGVPDAMLDAFPDEFREGMAARAERLGDRGPSAPEHWEAGLGPARRTSLATVYGDRRASGSSSGARGAARGRRAPAR